MTLASSTDTAVPTALTITHTVRLTMVMAAAATAVLIDVPGTTLLSDVLTSTATKKRFPTGSTFYSQRWEKLFVLSNAIDLMSGLMVSEKAATEEPTIKLL